MKSWNAHILLSILLRNIVLSLHVVEYKDDYTRRSGSVSRDYPDNRSDEINDDDDHHEIVTMLEERYKFINDNTSTRFKIANDGRYPVFPKSTNERKLAWAFRTYAVRRIVGGMETSISMYPYNVAISRNGKHWCGGSIIDEQWVFFPTKYAPGNADFDFSLLRLDRPMPIGRNIAVLNLPAKEYLVQTDDLLIVTGWGSTHESGFDHIPDRMRFVPVPVMKLEDCQAAYRFYITQRMMCAGYATGGKDACNHDSGGPAVRDGVLIGIVSFGGKKCGDSRSPGVYSRVTEITNWVEETISENEASEVPELKAKIEKARQREKELQKFKARVEEKKNKIKDWLRETLKSPSFLKLAKKKLAQAGVLVKKSFRRSYEPEYIDDNTLDEINLSHLISERILEDTERNEPEVLLRTLAMQEVVMNEDGELYERGSGDVETIVAYLTK